MVNVSEQVQPHLNEFKNINMKFFLTTILALILLSGMNCSNKKLASSCYKGRLEVKGMCSNYTIKLIEGNLAAERIEASWKDEVTGKTHTNVFALGSPCNFPDSIKEGDEFYFTLTEENQQCAVCMAYYPKPQKSLSIKVLDKACR